VCGCEREAPVRGVHEINKRRGIMERDFYDVRVLVLCLDGMEKSDF
jgi:hypothetical protein